MSATPSSNRSRLRTLAILAGVAIAVSGPLLEVLFPTSVDPADWVWPFGTLAFAPTAALILLRRRGNRIGQVLATVGTAAAVIFVGGWATLQLPAGTPAIVVEHLVNLGPVVLFWGLVALLHLFPDGRPIGRVWGWAFHVFTAALLGLIPIVTVLGPGPLPITGVGNPVGVDAPWVSGFRNFGLFFLPVGAVVGVASLVIRFRRAVLVERAQLKVFGFGAVLALILVAIIAVVPDAISPAVEAMLRSLVVVGFWALPIAIAVAVLRHRLYDIDRLVSRSVTYLIVVVILGLGYGATLLVLQSLLPLDSGVAVAGSTLAIASALGPLRRRVQRTVDRRFFRSRYDAETLMSHFERMVGATVDLVALEAGVRELLATSVGPTTLSLWVRTAD
ncbi:MAG: hypothetical protein R3246_02345 [Acidimicrobiia bacterium]|nr:hypothetical protein [Acidimicrobiia bacterium]